MAAVVYCPSCEAENNADAAKCGLCGHQLQAVARPLSEIADVLGLEAATLIQPPENQDEPKRRSIFSKPLRTQLSFRDDQLHALIETPRKQRTLRERWNTPLAQMTAKDVLWCWCELTLLSILIGLLVILLIEIV